MGFLKNGKLVESRFSEMFKNFNPSSEKDDINGHWDVEVKFKVDVKSIKKVLRSDETPNENFHWIELKNVNGKLGWLYGDADFFSFETWDYWIIVDKDVLQKFIKESVTKEFFTIPVKNKLYRRSGRKDVLTLISTIDLITISSCIIKKNNNNNEK